MHPSPKCYIPIIMIVFPRASSICVGLVLALGCGESGVSEKSLGHGSEPERPSMETELVTPSAGFSWIVPGELAAMPLPGRNRPLDQDAAYLEQEGIGVLISLTEEPPAATTLSSHSIEQRHLPVEDFAPPTQIQMTEFVSLVELSAANGVPVGVHCTAGLGRSGTMAAAYLVATGATADEAIETIRNLRPGSIETAAQEDAIRRFEQSRGHDE